MLLSIVKRDGAVYKNGVVYMGLNLTNIPEGVTALQFDSSANKGHIEYTPPIPNDDIDTLPSWANDCILAWEEADYIDKNPQKPSQERLIEICKERAIKLLEDTDWVELPSVSDTLLTPHLLNKQDFLQYRTAVRAFVVSPVSEPVWPTLPSANWSV